MTRIPPGETGKTVEESSWSRQVKVCNRPSLAGRSIVYDFTSDRIQC